MRMDQLVKKAEAVKEYIKNNYFEKKIEQEKLYFRTKHKRDMTTDEEKNYKFRIFVLYTSPLIILILFVIYKLFG